MDTVIIISWIWFSSMVWKLRPFSHHSLITFEFTLADQAAGHRKVCCSRYVSEDPRDRFGAEIASLFPLAYHQIIQLPMSPLQNLTAVSMTLQPQCVVWNSIAPMKKRFIHNRTLAMWYTPNIQTLKPTMEKRWRLSRSADSERLERQFIDVQEGPL